MFVLRSTYEEDTAALRRELMAAANEAHNLRTDNASLRNRITEIQLGVALQGVSIEVVPRKVVPEKVIDERLTIRRVKTK